MGASLSRSSSAPASSSSFSSRRNNDGLSAMGMLYLTIITNCWFLHEPRMLTDLINFRNSSPSSWWRSPSWHNDILWHSHNYTNVTSTVASLFTHADLEHLFSNMFLLWITGKQLFVRRSENFTQQQQDQHQSSSLSLFSWTSPLAFLWFYLGSQFLSVAGCRLICYWLDREWSRKVANDRKLWSWQWVPDLWRDAWFTLSNAQQVVELRVWQFRPSIGSSAAVYGVVGAHVYVSLCCREHPAKMDMRAKTIWLGRIAMELAKTPLSLEQISLLENGDNIDHASHICGFVGGFFLAFVWDRIFSRRRRYTQHDTRAEDL
uniref:Peptidase S54 rhomboid domain-containing protein n=1 Tax=Pseudo-nitzschia australis TaxID=44445 RepID=A0A6U9W7X7_9STRA|mmetsp:Transcript_6618/g.14084  ORF Transcript_6618/g.14084 Transcript_6618/m.14084 type:complete len:319 (-) Transcript_6618:84-1040(-)